MIPLSITVMSGPEEGTALVTHIRKTLEAEGVVVDMNVEPVNEAPNYELLKGDGKVVEIGFMPINPGIFEADPEEALDAPAAELPPATPEDVAKAWNSVCWRLPNDTKGYGYFYPDEAPEEIRGKPLTYVFNFGPLQIPARPFAMSQSDGEGFLGALSEQFPVPPTMREVTIGEITDADALIVGLSFGRGIPIGEYPGEEALEQAADAFQAQITNLSAPAKG